MDVLLDIVRFLKNLQNGQYEIEAGQSKLFEGLENLKQAMGELKSLKVDVDDMKTNNLEQMGLIKELEMKLDKLSQKYGEGQVAPQTPNHAENNNNVNDMSKGFKKRKICKRIEEVVDITSEISNEKTDSDEHASSPRLQDAGMETGNNKNEMSESTFSHMSFKRKDIESQSPYPKCFNNNDILHRYLKDSEKYLQGKIFKSDEVISDESGNNQSESWSSNDAFSPVTNVKRNSKPDKRHHTIVVKTRNPKNENHSNSFYCRFCPKKFTNMTSYIKHKRKHLQSNSGVSCKIKRQSKRPKCVTKTRVKHSKGFKCCYCFKVCRSPEKLTAHLRQCRIITKTPIFKKIIQ